MKRCSMPSSLRSASGSDYLIAVSNQGRPETNENLSLGDDVFMESLS